MKATNSFSFNEKGTSLFRVVGCLASATNIIHSLSLRHYAVPRLVDFTFDSHLNFLQTFSIAAIKSNIHRTRVKNKKLPKKPPSSKPAQNAATRIHLATVTVNSYTAACTTRATPSDGSCYNETWKGLELVVPAARRHLNSA